MNYSKKNLVRAIEQLAKNQGYDMAWFSEIGPRFYYEGGDLREKFQALLKYLDLEVRQDSCVVVKCKRMAEK